MNHHEPGLSSEIYLSLRRPALLIDYRCIRQYRGLLSDLMDNMIEDDEHELNDGDISEQPSSGLTRSQAWNLYVSHALSTWNARGYEFAAVGTMTLFIIIFLKREKKTLITPIIRMKLTMNQILFTAAAFPDTLVAAATRFDPPAPSCQSSSLSSSLGYRTDFGRLTSDSSLSLNKA